jgi:hypothetical protein
MKLFHLLPAAASIPTCEAPCTAPGQVLIAGGDTNTAERYDPVAKTFTPTRGSMLEERSYFSADSRMPIKFSDTVILTGGDDPIGEPLTSTDIYLPPISQ